MENIRTLILVCLLVLFGTNLSAQTTSLRFGVKAGLNLSSALVNNVSESSLKSSYQLGVTAEYQLPENFLIQSGLSFSAKGSIQEDLSASNYDGGTPDFTHTFNQLYLELPLYGAYRIYVSEKMNIVLGGGPYFAYGIGGKTKQKLNNGIWADGSTERKWDTFGNGVFNKDSDWLRGESLNRFDFGIGIKADLEYQKYVLGLGFTSSLINIMDNDDYSDLKYRNVNLEVSLGYKF